MEKGGEKKASEAAKTLSQLGASKGGKARAAALTPEQRKEIAQEAIAARWARQKLDTDEKLPKATHPGVLNIDGIEIPCAVLEEETRVLTQRGFSVALGRYKNPNRGQYAIVDLPPFLAAKNLQPFISEELRRSLTPVCFLSEKSGGVTKHGGKGGNIAYGYRAELLPQVCNVWLDAEEAGVLLPAQRHIAARCKILVRGFAVVGIIALVDEATGFQVNRDREALHKILEAYVTKEYLPLLPWSKRFPDEFYKQIFRLKGWKYIESNPRKGPRAISQITNKIVYEKLPPGVLAEIRKKSPVVYNHSRRKYRHHEFLTNDIGNPHLEKQVASVTTLMRIAPDKRWDIFERLFDRAFPVANTQIEMALDEEGEIWAAIEEEKE